MNAVDPDKLSNLKEDRINIIQVVLFAAKLMTVIALVFLAFYWLNAKMTDFIEAEHAEQRAKEEAQRDREDYERANAYYPMENHYDGQFQEIYEKRVNADYIFIGTSHTTHGVTPEAFEKSGKKFFNFALNGSNPSYYVWWYNDVFKANRYVKPKAVLFGVDWFMFDTDWLWRRPEFDFPYLRAVSRDPASNSGSGGEDDEYYGYYDESSSTSSVYKYQGKWYDVDAIITYVTNRFSVFSSRTRFIELIFPEKKEESDPESESGISEKKEKEKREYYRTPDGFVLSAFYKGYVPWEQEFGGWSAGEARCGKRSLDTERNSFISLLEQFKNEGIPVVFFMTPEYLPGRDAPQFDEMTDMINGIAKDYNIPFLNYNTDLESSINNDATCYSDWGHLNDKGAQAFSKKLYEDLNKILEFDK